MSFFLEGDGVLRAALDLSDDEPRQRVLPFDPDQVARIDGHRDEHAPFAVRNDDAPIGARGGVQRGRKNREILGAIGVGEDEDRIAMRLNLVAQAAFARRDPTRRRVLVGEIDEMAFARVVSVNRDDSEASAAAVSERNEPGGITLLEHDTIFALRRADPVKKDCVGAVVLVDANVEQA